MKPPFQLKDYLESLSAPFPSGHVLVLPLLVAELFSKVRTTTKTCCLFTFLIPHLGGMLQHSKTLMKDDEWCGAVPLLTSS